MNEKCSSIQIMDLESGSAENDTVREDDHWKSPQPPQAPEPEENKLKIQIDRCGAVPHSLSTPIFDKNHLGTDES